MNQCLFNILWFILDSRNKSPASSSGLNRTLFHINICQEESFLDLQGLNSNSGTMN